MGISLGTPIAMMVPNLDQRPKDYGEMDVYPRPSHADWTYLQKYSVKASSGGGRSSARETIGRVAASAIAEKYLAIAYGIEIVAFVASVGDITMEPAVPIGSKDKTAWIESYSKWWDFLKTVNRKMVDSNEVRCPAEISEKMRERIIQARDSHDSIGGTVVCVIRNLPPGLGEPCFDKFEAKLAHAMLSIPATKSFEVGSGLAGTCIPGSIHNDPFMLKNGKMGTQTNFSGGIQGGITNGEDVYFKVGFKSVATIGVPQETSTYSGELGVLEAKGRHDPCVLPRAVPIVESMAALVVMEYP
jgi:chorismate synthase